MAKLYKSKNKLKTKKYKYIFLCSTIIVFAAVFWIFAGIHFFKNGIINYVYIIISCAATLSAVFITLYSKKQISIINSGLSGEKSAKKLVGYLPDNYRIITNAEIEYKGRTSETDMIIVGRNGIFIIEVKNHNGKISGSADSQKWTQHKTGKGGGEYAKQFYNPIKQVSTHIYRLSNFLRKNGINIWIHAIVYFSNPDAEVFAENPSEEIPVITASHGGLKKLSQYIVNSRSEHNLSQNDINKIVKIIK